LANTDIRIDSSSEIPIRQQLIEQIIFLIATGVLSAPQFVPSVRDLARRLKIHHNTVSEAYKELVRRKWLARRHGSRLVVISRQILAVPDTTQSLDDIINLTIQMAHTMGYSLQSLRARVRERLMLAPPDHLLVIEQDEGLREILCDEIRSALPYTVKGCSQEDLAANPGIAIGALAVASLYSTGKVDELFPKDRPIVPVKYNKADEHIRRIRELSQPSVIAVVSTSARFLTVARSVLAQAIGSGHQLREVLLPGEKPPAPRSADIVFCDSIAKRTLRSARVIHYSLVTPRSLEQVDAAMKAYQISV